jgi:spermidine/putrescine transport system substrate-binding protein
MTENNNFPNDDPALVRGMTQRRRQGPRRPAAPGYSRREAFGLGGLAAAGLGLAACGVSGAGKAQSTGQVGNTYSIPWASGSTGIAWNPKYITTPVTSINDLWNPAYKGHVGMMSDIQEIGNFGMIKLGINPQASKPADWTKAAATLTAQRNAGLVRQYYDQSYINALTKGDTWITMAWSGDIFQQNLSSGSNLQFVVPKEGGSIWTDNMMIPKYTQNPVDAMMLMDWYYRPEIAAMLTESINYITAVPAVRALISSAAGQATGATKQTLTEVAGSSLVWPTSAVYNRLYNYADVSGKLKDQYSSIFQPVVAG